MTEARAEPAEEPSESPDADPSSDEVDADPPDNWPLSILLFALTLASTTYVMGLEYSIPLMAILLCHEFGHYFAAKLHRVPASPPYFIPMPVFFLGTLGAVILMRPERIKSRDVLFDIAAAGPIAGMVVALPVLIYGILESPVQPTSTELHWVEGRSLLYSALLHGLKGPIPAGYDIHLTQTAVAGWAGLFVTMLNLLPIGQLDGGHVGHALLGERHATFSRVLRWLLLPLGLVIAAIYGLPALLSGKGAGGLWSAVQPGLSWLIWFALLTMVRRWTDAEHPPTDPVALSPFRRLLAIGLLALFVLLFMPVWLRVVEPTT